MFPGKNVESRGSRTKIKKKPNKSSSFSSILWGILEYKLYLKFVSLFCLQEARLSNFYTSQSLALGFFQREGVGSVKPVGNSAGKAAPVAQGRLVLQRQRQVETIRSKTHRIWSLDLGCLGRISNQFTLRLLHI